MIVIEDVHLFVMATIKPNLFTIRSKLNLILVNNFPGATINICDVVLILCPSIISSKGDLLMYIFVVVIDPNPNEITIGHRTVKWGPFSLNYTGTCWRCLGDSVDVCARFVWCETCRIPISTRMQKPTATRLVRICVLFIYYLLSIEPYLVYESYYRS